MNFIKKIDNVISLSIPAFEKGLEMGLMVFHSNEQFKVISTNNYETLFESNDDLGAYHIFSKRLFVTKPSVVFEVDLEQMALKTICTTQKNRISIHGLDYCSAITTQRNPKLKSGEIIRISDSKIVHSWNEEKNVLTIDDHFIFFYKRDGQLQYFDSRSGKQAWSLKLDNGSFGQRIIAQTNDVFYLQRAISKPDTFSVLALEKSTGNIIWETENTHPYYCFDEASHKLYGLGDKCFEVINALTGEKELVAELDVNVFISSHLTHYYDGLLYFSSHLDNSMPVFGAVNVKTGKLQFIQDIKISKKKSFRLGLEKPIVVSDKLYLKDSLNSLHVFERQKGSR